MQIVLAKHKFCQLRYQFRQVAMAKIICIVKFESLNLGLLSERLRLSAFWEPLGGSPEHPQLGPDIGGWG